jgi:type I restriction enzyme S subunit
MPELQDDGKYRIVRVGNFSGKNEWFYSDMELEDDKYCEKGDLLYKWACNFGPEIWDEEKVIYHYHIWKIIPNEQINREYMYHFLKYSTPLWLGGTNGATMVHITKESMEKKKIIIPSQSIMTEFGDIVGEIISRVQLLKEQNTNLTRQRDLLLPRLMSGKLQVK